MQKARVGLSEIQVQVAWELHPVRNSATYHSLTQMATQKADLATSKSSWIARLLLISFLWRAPSAQLVSRPAMK